MRGRFSAGNKYIVRVIIGLLLLMIFFIPCVFGTRKNVSREKSPTPSIKQTLQNSDAKHKKWLTPIKDPLTRAKELYEDRNYKAAIEEIKSIIDARPHYTPAYQLAGDALIEAKRYREAAVYLEKAIKLDPSASMSRILLGESYYEAGEYYKALEVFKETARLEPDNFDAVLDIGETYAALGNPDKAEIYIRKASQMKPDYFSPYNELGNLYFMKKNYDKAEKYYKKSLSLKPDYEDAMMGLSLVYAARGEYSKAEKQIKEALRISPYEWGQGLSCLGDIYMMQDKEKTAETVYLQAIRQDIYNSQGYYYLGNLYAKQNRLDEAEKILKQSIKVNEQTAWTGKIYLLLSSISIRKNDTVTGYEYFKKALKSNKNLKDEIISNKIFEKLKFSPEYKNLINTDKN